MLSYLVLDCCRQVLVPTHSDTGLVHADDGLVYSYAGLVRADAGLVLVNSSKVRWEQDTNLQAIPHTFTGNRREFFCHSAPPGDGNF